MISYIDFAASRRTPLDHAVREAARTYADQVIHPGRAAAPLAVRHDRADTVYARQPTILLDQVEVFSPASLGSTTRSEIADRVEFELGVALSAELAFHRRLSFSSDALAGTIASGGRHAAPIEQAMAVYRWLAWQATPVEQSAILAMRINRAHRFLDANRAAIIALADAAAKIVPGADRWATMPAHVAEQIIARRPAKLSDTQRKQQDSRCTRDAWTSGKQVCELLGIGPVD